MLGLRTKESEKFVKYFAIVQDAAEKQGCIYYLDAGDGRDFETEEYEGEDLMGWLIPKDKQAEFELEWRKGDVSDDWSDYYIWAIWNNPSKPYVTFET